MFGSAMARSIVALLGIGILLLVAGCGGGGTYSLDQTKSCLAGRGVRVGGKLDFVATTATGGAFVAHLGDNFVTVAFGNTVNTGAGLESAYTRFALPNVRAGVSDVLRRYDNAVTLWHLHPSAGDLSLVVGCLH